MYMKAAQYRTYGDPQVIEIIDNVQKPSLKDGQVLIEVHAASINPFDFKLRQGYMKDAIPLTLPVTLGGDFAGVVAEVGEGVEGFLVGDEVYGQGLIVNGGSGSLAEYVAANAKNISKKPQHVDFQQAAALVLVGVSAQQALEEHIQLTQDQKILIHGGAGGIGSIAIQLAKHLGAFVVTTVGSDDIEFAENLGADEVIDYKTQKFEEILKDLDAVFDTVGGETTVKSVSTIKHGGTLVTMADTPDEALTKERGITAIAQFTGVNSQRLKRLTELVDEGVIKPQIDKVFSLDQAKDAFDHLENGHPNGKVIIQVKG